MLGLALGGCGSMGAGTSRPESVADTSPAVSPDNPSVGADYDKHDGDDDRDDGRHGPGKEPIRDDVTLLAEAGRPVRPLDRRLMEATARSYYEAVAAGNPAAACALLDSQLRGSASVAECASRLGVTIEQQRAQFSADEPATLRVTTARVKGDFAMAVLGFKNAVEREILLAREGETWKIDALADSIMP